MSTKHFVQLVYIYNAVLLFSIYTLVIEEHKPTSGTSKYSYVYKWLVTSLASSFTSKQTICKILHQNSKQTRQQ